MAKDRHNLLYNICILFRGSYLSWCRKGSERHDVDPLCTWEPWLLCSASRTAGGCCCTLTWSPSQLPQQEHELKITLNAGMENTEGVQCQCSPLASKLPSTATNCWITGITGNVNKHQPYVRWSMRASLYWPTEFLMVDKHKLFLLINLLRYYFPFQLFKVRFFFLKELWIMPLIYTM